MQQSKAAAGSAVFFLAAPGVVAGLIPWLLTGWRLPDGPIGPLGVAAMIVGGALILAGTAFLVSAFIRFVTEGLGTPAPIAPPSRLVIGGVYRFVRNPMYVAVLAVIIGQSLVFQHLGLLAYAVAAFVLVLAFVTFYEEPHLTREFGADYEAYKRAVPGWWPRWTPWTPPGQP